MSDNGNKSDDPSIAIQQQPLLATKEPPKPPTYQEATEGNAPNVATAATAAPTVVVVTEPMVYGPHPIDVQCPYCHNYCRTRLGHKPNSRTHLMALLLCLFQLYCCVCLPYCIGSCNDVNHYCGICDRYLGTFKR